MGWSFHMSRSGNRPITRDVEITPSVTITSGAGLEIGTDGKHKAAASQTAVLEAIANHDFTSTATGLNRMQVLDPLLEDGIWKAPFTPVLNARTGQAGGSTTQAIVVNNSGVNYSGDDFKGGQIYCVETNEQRTISASGAANNGANMTVDCTQPWSRVTDGLTFRLTPLGIDVKAAKLIASTFDTVTQAIADLTGGKCQIFGGPGEGQPGYGTGIDLKNNTLYAIHRR